MKNSGTVRYERLDEPAESQISLEVAPTSSVDESVVVLSRFPNMPKGYP